MTPAQFKEVLVYCPFGGKSDGKYARVEGVHSQSVTEQSGQVVYASLVGARRVEYGHGIIEFSPVKHVPEQEGGNSPHGSANASGERLGKAKEEVRGAEVWVEACTQDLEGVRITSEEAGARWWTASGFTWFKEVKRDRTSAREWG